LPLIIIEVLYNTKNSTFISFVTTFHAEFKSHLWLYYHIVSQVIVRVGCAKSRS